MVNNKAYFDAHVHSYHKDASFYHSLKTNIDKIAPPLRLLDLGCGDGSFIKSLIGNGVNGNYLGIDISNSMVHAALESLRDHEVNLILADGFSLPLTPASEFDLVHLDSVLHHLIGKTRSESKKLALEMLDILARNVPRNGFILVEEMYYESYVFRTFTAFLIFYGLKLFNFLKVDMNKIVRSIIPGLEVNFYSEKEIMDMLSLYGSVTVIKRMEVRVSRIQRLFLQKKFGHISLLIKKDRK